MANENPTGSGGAAAVQVPEKHREFILDTLDAARDGLLFDLSHGLLGNPERAKLEIDAYTRLVALTAGEAVPVDEGMRATLRELALTVDKMNEYERVAFEHAALWGALLRMERAASAEPATPDPDGEYGRFLGEHEVLLGDTTAGRTLPRRGLWRWLWGGGR